MALSPAYPLEYNPGAVVITGGTINGTPIGGTTPAAGAFTTLSASGAVTLSGGTANGIVYLNGSKVATTGSALTFNGTTITLTSAATTQTAYSSTLSSLTTGIGYDATSSSITTGALFRAYSSSANTGAHWLFNSVIDSTTATGAACYRAFNDSNGQAILISKGHQAVPATITAAATTGAQEINKMSGSVNFAAAASSLVVTNSLVSTNSVIICTVATNDSSFTSAQAVAGSGSFTIYANAAANAETRVNFLVMNKGD